MLQLTRDGEYAVRAVLYLASQPEGKVSLVNEISEAQDVPKSYLSKIMQHLTKAGLVKSRRGAKGGFMLARSAEQITLRYIRPFQSTYPFRLYNKFNKLAPVARRVHLLELSFPL